MAAKHALTTSRIASPARPATRESGLASSLVRRLHLPELFRRKPRDWTSMRVSRRATLRWVAPERRTYPAMSTNITAAGKDVS